MSLYSSWVAHHHCHLSSVLCSSLLCLFDFLHIGKDRSCALRQLSLKINQLSWHPLACREGILPVILRSRFLNRPRSCLLNSRPIIPVFILLIYPRILNSTISWLLQQSLLSVFASTASSWLWVTIPAEHSPLSTCWLCQEVVFYEISGAYRFLVLCHFALPADTRVVQVPHGNQSL